VNEITFTVQYQANGMYRLSYNNNLSGCSGSFPTPFRNPQDIAEEIKRKVAEHESDKARLAK
jgi:hypothetical protein